MEKLNYAKVYSESLAQAFPYTLNFGALYSTKNNGRYRFKGGKTIEIPVIKTTGRTDADRDTIGTLSRNYENTWEEKELTNQRKWSTLVHPQDVDQTNYAATISNITSVFNTEHKFPEMDAYTISKLLSDWVSITGSTPDIEDVSENNVLSIFDSLMARMSEKRVPVNGRILYVTPSVMKCLKNSNAITRTLDVQSEGGSVNRTITTLDGVQVVEVPSELMKESYDFSNGVTPTSGACQIQMFLVHPDAVITPVSYEFACLDEPSAATGGKYAYYEESFEDVFILNNKVDALAFVVKAG